MKVAVLADIHGNINAFQTVADHIASWRPDVVVMAGDVINRGPRPVECLDLLRIKRILAGWQVVRGNHEDYVLDQANSDAPRSGPLFEISRNALWTYQLLDGQVSDLKDMPFQVSFPGPDGNEFRVVHASMRGNRDGIYPEASDGELLQKIYPPPAVLCVGHTHRPLIRQINQTLVVNVGSVGTPFDEDRRSCYAQLTWLNGIWQAALIRLTYDRVSAKKAYYTSGFMDEAGPLAKLMYLEFHQALAHIHRFFLLYEELILTGQIALHQAVHDYLASY